MVVAHGEHIENQTTELHLVDPDSDCSHPLPNLTAANLVRKMIEVVECPMGIAGFSAKDTLVRQALSNMIIYLLTPESPSVPSQFANTEYLAEQFTMVMQEMRARIKES